MEILNDLQISKKADGILFLSLISGRNAELLIGKHVIAAPVLKASLLEVLPTGYMLIESGKQTSASYMSNTNPIPADKDDIAMCTAMAGEMLGLKLIYMDAGSGAINAVSETMIKKVSTNINIPLIIGGGINSAEKALKACRAGADVIVVGNGIEKKVSLIKTIAKAVHSF
jgi:phosphoglycerol geranylgeranyltransferase